MTVQYCDLSHATPQGSMTLIWRSVHSGRGNGSGSCAPLPLQSRFSLGVFRLHPAWWHPRTFDRLSRLVSQHHPTSHKLFDAQLQHYCPLANLPGGC